MASCSNCGKKFGFLETGVGGLCTQCDYLASVDPSEVDDIVQHAQLKQEIEDVLLTTETAPNLNITKRIEIVTAECALGMNMFKDLFAGVRNAVGGRSEAVQETMRDSRRMALYELKKEAYEVGANAVVGVDLDYIELSTAGPAGTMVMLAASGTAVVIEEHDDA